MIENKLMLNNEENIDLYISALEQLIKELKTSKTIINSFHIDKHYGAEDCLPPLYSCSPGIPSTFTREFDGRRKVKIEVEYIL